MPGSARALILISLVLASATAALAAERGFFPLGIQIRNLTDLGAIGPELRAAGFNCVLSAAPKGGALIPSLWHAQGLGLRVLLSSEGLGNPAAEENTSSQRVRLYYEASAWTREHPAYLGWVFEPLGWMGVAAEDTAAYLLAAKAGNPQALSVLSAALDEPFARIRQQTQQADAVVLWLSTEEWTEEAAGPVGDRLRALIGERHENRPIWVMLPGRESRPGVLTAAALQALAETALEAGAQGLLFPAAETEAVREAQFQVAGELARRLGLAPNPTAAQQASRLRADVLRQEAARPLLWTLRHFGETTAAAGLEEYRTPDATTGFRVTDRAFLSLAIPSRSGWVDTAHLTRLSMRMFSTTEGQGALLALSTANEVSYTRVQVQAGWHLYVLDLPTATWEGNVAEALRWGGSTGRVHGLTFSPPPVVGAQVAFDWIRLEPPEDGEVLWELEDLTEISDLGGWEGLDLVDGELRGTATAAEAWLEPRLPGSELAVGTLPFLSLRVNCPAEGRVAVEYWRQREGREEYGGRAYLPVRAGWQTLCVDLSQRGFAAARLTGDERWGEPGATITRLRLILPAQPGSEVAVDWARLGPNYDLRAAPSELLPEELPRGEVTE